MRVLSAFLVASVLLFGACTEPKQTGLTGSWAESPSPNLVRQLNLAPNGRFVFYVASSGGAHTTILGAWTASDNHLTFVTDKRIDYDANGVSTTTTPYTDTRFFEGATYTITGDDTLTLTYVTYPADAPVTTTITLHRMLPID